MSDNNSTTSDTQGQTIRSRLSSLLIQIVHVFLTLLQTSHVAVVALLLMVRTSPQHSTAQHAARGRKVWRSHDLTSLRQYHISFHDTLERGNVTVYSTGNTSNANCGGQNVQILL